MEAVMMFFCLIISWRKWEHYVELIEGEVKKHFSRMCITPRPQPHKIDGRLMYVFRMSHFVLFVKLIPK